MVIPKINSAHGSDTRNIINAAIDSINAQGKSIQDLVAEGQLTPTQYTLLIETINGLVKSGDVKKEDLGTNLRKEIESFRKDTNIKPIDVDEMNTRTKQLFTGGAVAVVGENSVGRENIKEKAVAPKNTNFATSKNLAGDLVKDFSLMGAVGDTSFFNTVGAHSFITKLEQGKTYTMSKSVSDRFRVVTSSGYPVIGEKTSRTILSNDTALTTTFTLQENEDYVIAYVSTSDGTPPVEFQIEEGTEKTPYSPVGESVRIDFAEKSIPSKALHNVSGTLKTTGMLVGSDSSFNISLKNQTVTTSGGGGYVYADNERYQLSTGTWSYSSVPSQSVLIGFNKDNKSIVFSSSSESISENTVLLGVIRKSSLNYQVNGLHRLEGKRVGPLGDAVAKIENQIESIATPKNLFKGDFQGIYIYGPLGDGEFRNSYSGSDSASGFSYITKIEPGQTYTVSKTESDRFRLATSTEYPSHGMKVNKYLRHADSLLTHTFVAGPNDNYLVAYVTISGEAPTEFQVELGSEATEFSDEVFLKFGDEDRFFIADKASGNYLSSTPYVPPVRSIEAIYAIYDDLVARFPNYVSKVFLANDESGLPIYRYDFKPVDIRQGNPIPKIIYTATHGHENQATYGGALFFKELCEKWKDSDVIRVMRWNVHFIVVPNCNPWGFNNNTRPNFNGVDLARNYPSGWSPEYTDIRYDYPGTEPLTEVGTQVMDGIMQENRDAFFAIDHHNYGGDPFNGGTLIWLKPADKDTKLLLRSYAHNMIVQSKGIIEGLSEDTKLGDIGATPAGGSFARHLSQYSIRGTLLECANTLNGNGSSPDIQKINMNFLGNMVLTSLRFYTR